MKILVSGLLNIETTVSVRGFPINYYPIDYPFFGVNSNASGVGLNIAKALSALGDDVDLLSFLGNDDEAKRIISELECDSISTEHIRQSLKNTPVSVVLFDPQGKRQIYCDLKDIQDQLIDPAEEKHALESSDAAVLCNINFNRELVKAARRSGVLTATDVHVLSSTDDDYNRDFMENADILFLSDEKLPCGPEDFIMQLCDRYHNKIIVLRMGAKGAMLFESDSGEMTLVPAYTDVKVVNTIGAGDALFSSFLHFYVKSGNAKQALKRAVIFAGIKIGTNGASLGFCSEQKIERIVSG